MDKQQLNARLQELHSELKQVDSLDETEARVLRQLSDDIQELLDHSREHAGHKYTTLGERLRNGIDLLEASHPKVTMLMGQAADVLAKMGI